MKFLHSVKRTACLMISLFASPSLPPARRYWPERATVTAIPEKVVIFSRHNLRSPMSTDNEKRNALTPHHWQKGKEIRGTSPSGAGF